jgi:hypothetical protein
LLTIEQLKQVVHKPGVTKTDVALLCVAAGGGTGVSTARVRRLALEAGVKGAKSINFSAHLSSAEDKVFRTPKGWELTQAGWAHAAALAGKVLYTTPAAKQARELRDLLPKVKNEDARSFLLEAVVCAEQSLFRAAVVLSWVGAVSLLYEAAASKHLAAVNAEVARRDPRWRPAKSVADLGRLKDSVFLDVAESVGLIDRNVKQELEGCLKLRNACGHPSSLKIGANKVAAHLEILALNVYAVHAQAT